MTDYDKLYAQQSDVCGDAFPEFTRAFAALPPGCSILDLGCGQGRDALVAARCGHRVVGVDLSQAGVTQMVRAAEKEGLAVTGLVADIATFEPDSVWDVIVLDRVLHMLAGRETRRDVLARMVERVAPGGRLLIADTPTNLPMIRAFMRAQGAGWRGTLSRKGFSFWQRRDSARDLDHTAET